MVFKNILTRVTARLLLPSMLALATSAGFLVASPAAVGAHARQIHTATIEAHDNGSATKFAGWYSMPSKVPTGLVEFTFHNDGTQSHMAQFFKLNSGVSESTFLTKLKLLFASQDPKKTVFALHELLEISAAAGGANSVEPGASQRVFERLTAGHYVVVCFDSTPDGTPHFLLGMHKSFWASAKAWAPVDTDEKVVDGAVKSNGTVNEFDHSITIPSVLRKDRPLVIKITVSDQTHEFQLLKLPSGTTKAQLLQCLTGPQSSCQLKGRPMDAGGASAIAPGSTHWAEFHLESGTYAALCFVPDINTGMPHAFMGMITVFTVSK